MLYGLESLLLKPSHLTLLGKTHRKFLRSIQGLPIRVATPGIFLLLGELTLEAQIHIKTLVFLRMVLSDTQAIQHDLALHTVLLKDPLSHSWSVYVDNILEKYDLPNITSDTETSHWAVE